MKHYQKIMESFEYNMGLFFGVFIVVYISCLMHSTYNIKMGFCVVFAILGRREDVGHDKGTHHPPDHKKWSVGKE